MMSFSLSGGVEVYGFIAPTEITDEYPVIDPLYGIDGFRNVNTLSDLNSITNLRRRAGMVVGVSGGTQYYKLNPGPWNGTITDWTIFNSGGGGAFTGGTVTGDTIFTQGVTATTFSASTYLGLPLDVYTTGFTYNNNTFTISDTSGNTFSTTIDTMTGLTVNGVLSATTYQNLPQYYAGVISGSTNWVNNNDGSITLPNLQVALFSTPDFSGPLNLYDISSTSFVLNNEDTNYIGVDYNGGSPIYFLSNNDGLINDSDVILYLIVYRSNNFLHILEFGDYGSGLPNKLNDRVLMTDRFAHESGCILGLSGSTGVVTLTDGVVWNGVNREVISAVTSNDGVFFQNYHVNGNWVYTTTASTLNNEFYDDGTNLVSATTGNYLVNWYFRGQEVNDHLYEVFGNNEYVSVAAAELSLEPLLPELITSHAFIVGRIIVGVGQTTGLTQTAFVTPFVSTQVTNHNDLLGLQGGGPGEYYHLSSNEYNNLAYTNVDNNFSVDQTINGDLIANNFFGTTNYIPKFTPNSYSIGNSIITNNSNNVSIGTISTPYRFYVLGNNTTAGQPLFVVRDTGRIGIRTASPLAELSIENSNPALSQDIMTLRNNGTGIGTGNSIRFINSTNSSSTVGSKIESTITNLSGRNVIKFFVHGGGGAFGGLQERMSIDGTGSLFVSNLNANVISGNTYLNLPLDVYVTGYTYQDNTFTISDTSGNTFSSTIDVMTGLTVNGILSATTISGGTLYGDGSNLTGLSSGLNVGTTQITNGTDTRVLFQSGTTLQQDNNFTFDSTLKRLTLRAGGSTVTDIPFIVRNSADTTDNFIVNGLGEGYFKSQQAQPYGLTIENTQTSSSSENTLGSRITFVSAGANIGDRAYIHYHNSNGGGSSAGTFIFSSPRGFRMDSPGTYLSDNYRFTTTSSGNHLAFTALGSGNILRLNVAGGGSTSSEIQIANALSNYSYWRAPNSDVNHAMSWGRTSTEFMRLNQSGWLGIGTGASIGARLDVRSQGALSTDIAFRVRNSADTANLIESRGNGHLIVSNSNFADVFTAQNSIESFRVGGGNLNYVRTTQSGNLTFVIRNGASSNALITFNAGAGNSVFWENLFAFDTTTKNVTVFGGSAIAGGNSGDSVMWVRSGTSTPSTSFADMFGLYSADRGGTSGRASAHFRSEDGTINVLGDRTGINTSTPQARFHVANADTTLTTGLFSGSGQNILTVIGSGSTQPLFTVQGSSGELFSITDSLIGSLFSVNDISGLPILEVFSDNTTLMGSYLAPSLNTTSRVVATTGTTNVYSIPTSAYTGAFFDYTVSDGTNLRAGNIMSIWSGSSVNITETQTTDFGNTSGLTFNMVVSSGNAILRTSGVTGNWTVKTIVRSI